MLFLFASLEALSIIGVLVVLTNIVVQVLKKVTWDKLPTNALAIGLTHLFSADPLKAHMMERKYI